MLIERARESRIEGSVYGTLRCGAELLGLDVEPWIFESLQPSRPRLLRRWLHEALAADTRRRGSEPAPEALLRRWWSNQRKHSRLRLIKLLDPLEFIFPRRADLGLRHRYESKIAATAIYPLHVGKGLSLLALVSLPWA